MSFSHSCHENEIISFDQAEQEYEPSGGPSQPSRMKSFASQVLSLATLFAIGAAAPVQAEVYWFTDENGVTHFTGDGGRYILQRKMSGGERDPHPASHKHHDRIPPCQLGQVFRMSGESDTGIIDDTLMHRRCHHRVEFTPTASDSGSLQGRKNIASIDWCNFSGDGGFSQWNMQYVKATCLFAVSRQGRIVGDMQGELQLPRAFLKKVAVGNDDQIEGQRLLSDPYAQIGADPGWLARGKGELNPIRTQPLRNGVQGSDSTPPPIGIPRTRGPATFAATPGMPHPPCAHELPDGRPAAAAPGSHPAYAAQRLV